MGRKIKNKINQESREEYSDEAAEGATALLQGDEEFEGTDEKFDARKRTRSTQNTQKRARRGHACRGQGKWPGMQ